MKQGTLYIYSNYDLYDRYDDTKEYLMDEYPELCDVEVEDAKTGEISYEPSDKAVWDEIYFGDECDWDNTFSELKQFFKDKMCIMFGTIGLWDGNFAGGKIGRFEDLFYSITKDCSYWEFTDEEGHLRLKCSHHDGCHNVEVRVLTDKGYDYSENWAYGYSKKYDYSEQEMHNRIINCSFLSRLPYYCKKSWGL